ncbi:hypothetical protein FO519_008598 [Halicephalobus sp. NKZ332]|nr:hypothetical protein FO519_008598 [Halicephalobus sp. NKZ332]
MAFLKKFLNGGDLKPNNRVYQVENGIPKVPSDNYGIPKTSALHEITVTDENGESKLEFSTKKNGALGSDDDSTGTLAKGDGEKFEGFGWITGVFMRCVLCIFGATLFLRMSWIAGQGGILLGLCVILLSCLVVIITAVSMSAIATNGEVKNGGLYYLVSRSLGPEYGGAIGLIFYLANTVNASMNCVGLAEAIVDILNGYDIKLVDGGTNDIRIYGLAICLALQMIIFIGTEFENKTQILLMVSIVVSIISHFIGTLLPLSPDQINAGITGFSWKVFTMNMMPDFREGITFVTIFGVYFPAMTGIMGGANMSGDLKDPSKSIPKGTMWAIAATTVTYSWCMLVTAGTTVRDASGTGPPQFDNVTHDFIEPACRATESCKYGLANDYQVMKVQGAWPPLIIVGIFATTLSSASGCLIGAPRVFQALCADKLFPFIEFFAKGHGKSNDPFRGYFLTFFLAAAIICIGNLNAIAEMITNFFLAAFAITNFACFDATLSRAPGFRPGFKYYDKWLSLFGAFLCVGLMFVISWITSLVTLIIFGVLFLYIKHNKSHINWGSSTEANRYRKALNGLVKVTRQADHVKNYRPQLLVLTGNPSARHALVDFANSITKGENLLLCGHVIPCMTSVTTTTCIKKLAYRFTDWMYENKIKGFYGAVGNPSLRVGVQTLLQTVGLGKMQPNIITLGYKKRWVEDALNDIDVYRDYTGVIFDAFEADMAVCVIRNGNDGFDHSALSTTEMDSLSSTLLDLFSDKNSMLSDDLSRGVVPRLSRPRASGALRRMSNPSMMRLNTLSIPKSPSGRSVSEECSSSPTGKQETHSKPLNIYRAKFKGGFVDVWWLFDDGGLILLLAYLLTHRHTFLEDCKLRFFAIIDESEDPERKKEKVEKSLKKFRINYSEVIVIVNEGKDIYEETSEEFNEILEELNRPDRKPLISEDILAETKSETQAFLKLREHLLQYSMMSNFVIMTLPVAAQKIILSPLYMLWLELLTKDMPPTLFVRGNQASVITYYS